MRKIFAAVLALGLSAPAQAVEFHFDGYADLRLIVPSNQVSWEDGLLGKLRYGAEHNKPELRFAEAVGQAAALITPELTALAVMRIDPDQRTFVDFLEAYVRYRPVSTTAWRWSVKAGAFFPPVSLENTDIGWTSPWTLTPSAINSWVGEELRTIGGEGALEYRSQARTITGIASIYGWNDPTGVLVADRGWALHDRPTGLIDRPRLPNAIAASQKLKAPLYTYEVLEIDGRPGWYAGASWDEVGLAYFNFIYYNNQANPKVKQVNTMAWRTDFWGAGARTQIGDVTLMAQGMIGNTLIIPSKSFFSDTHFQSAYWLAGWTISEEWRIAARADVFSTDEKRPNPNNLSEHGNALTFAVNYLPYDWLRITGEAIRVDSTRNQRKQSGLLPHAVESQLQLSAKIYLP